MADKSRHLQIRMHDFPLLDHDIEKVVVDIREIQVHHTEKGWLTVSSEPRKYDLLELQNGITALIFDQTLEIGSYTQIRLDLNQHNEVFVKGRPYRLTVPSGEETGVKLITPFEIKEGKMAEVTLDFDAQRSVQLVKGQGFKLKPVIKVERIAEYDGLGIVSPEGGAVASLDGDFRVVVPPGAVTGSIVMSMKEVDLTALPDPGIPRSRFIGKAYELEPHGQAFATSVTLQVTYDEGLVKSLGAESNIVLMTYDETAQKWTVVPSTVVGSANMVQAQLSHFSKFALALPTTCTDGVKQDDETGVDCGGVCSTQCIDCNDYAVLAGAAPTGSGKMASLYSFGDPDVKAAAEKAKTEYAAELGVSPSVIDTPDEKMEAVALYVHRHMAYMLDPIEINANLNIPLSAWGLGDFLPGGDLSPVPLPPGVDVGDLPGFPLPPLPPYTETILQKSVTAAISAIQIAQDPPLTLNGPLDAVFQNALCEIGTVPVPELEPLFNYFLEKVYADIEETWSYAKPQTAAETVKNSISRSGRKNIDDHNKPCTELVPDGGGPTEYCGDCEDFAVLRASLLRHLGVAQQCIMNVDFHNVGFWPGGANSSIPISMSGPVGAPSPYDYETAQNLFGMGGVDLPELPDELVEIGHTFNVVLYKSKYRIMDYSGLAPFRGQLPLYEISTEDPSFAIHQGDNVWNDQFGRYWFPEFKGLTNPFIPSCDVAGGLPAQSLGIALGYTLPSDKARNYPGGNACYESGSNFWTFKTWYGDICP